MAKPNRNDPCPCGSGKRYKHCCGSVASPGTSVGGAAAEGPADVMAGLRLHQAGRIGEAEVIYRQVLGRDPENPDALHMLGLIEYQAGKIDQSTELIGLAVKLKPDDPFALNNLGAAYMGARRFREAAEAFRRAVQLKPDYAEALANLAGALKDSGQVEESIASYRRALAVDPGNSRAWNNLGNALRDTGEGTEASDCYRRAIAANPANAEAYNNLGVALATERRLPEALDCYRHALSIRPAFADAHLNLGNACKDMGNLDESIASYREAVRLEPGNEVATHLLAALTGAGAERAPSRYVAGVFDGYADRFDDHLVHGLAYRIPEHLVALLLKHEVPAQGDWEVLDLGCGTGLAGEAIASRARRIVGIDLSANMLAKAKERNIYQRLLQADLLPAMRDEPAAGYDVVLAADVFVYLGRLDEVVAQVARLLRPGGAFAFSVEALEALPEAKRGDGQGFVLNDKGRFAHAAPYIERLAAANGLSLLEMTGVQSRLEQGVPVQGWLVLMAR
ncbi:MAG: tetratricopeptide repeat protein [Rhodocyclales bacterium]|nr:tetratricopeptide repeat protein [Rhodocyclales bacterium]